MNLPSSRLLAGACVLLLSSGALLVHSTDEPRGYASELDPLQDADGDFLPDGVEWVLLSDKDSIDSDGDGQDDFLDALGFGQLNASTTTVTTDHAARFTVLSTIDRRGDRHVWLLAMMHIVGGDLSAVDSFNMYLDWDSLRFPLNSMLGARRVHVQTRGPAPDLKALFAFELLDESMLRSLLPCSLTAEITMDGRTWSNSTMLFETDGALTTFSPMPDNSSFVVQTLNSADAKSPYWNDERICVLDLSRVTGTLYVVSRADCEPAPGLACVSTCDSMPGRHFPIPRGLGSLVGH